MGRYLLIDIGGSSIKYAVSDESLNFSLTGRAACQMRSEYQEFLGWIMDIKNTVGDVDGIAISMPGLIDYEKGVCFGSSMLKGREVKEVKKDLEELTKVRVTVNNDGYCATLAEVGYGNMVGHQNGIVTVLGTGIGGGVVINGKLYTGSHISAGNFSFIYSDINDLNNKSTMFTNYNGIEGLKKAIKETSGLDDVDGIKCFELIKQGNKEVETGLKLFCSRLAYQYYNIQCILDVERVLVGGGISNEPLFIEYVRNAVDEYWSKVAVPLRKPKIMTCKYNSNSNLLGALYQFLNM